MNKTFDTNEGLNPGKYLVCVDDSDVARVALRFASMKAKRRGGIVEVLHVLQPADFQSLSIVADKMREERREEAEALLQQITKEAYDYSGLTPSINLKEGQLGNVIVETALEDPDVNMLVLGASPKGTGHGKLAAWLAEQLGDTLLVPMMLVPGNLTEQQIEELS